MIRPAVQFAERVGRSAMFRWARLVTLRRSTRFSSDCARAGEGVRIGRGTTVTGTNRIEVGDNVHIGDGAFIRAEGGLEIGSNTHISRNVVIYTMNHDTKGTRLPYDEIQRYRPVRIGRNVWIGMNVCVAPGSVIGDGATVAMGAVVSGTVASLAVVAAAPLREIGRRDEDHYRRLDEAGAYGGPGGHAYGRAVATPDAAT